MARILVTGGAGFIGSHCVEFIINAGHNPVVLDDFSTGFRENLRYIESDTDIREGSILDREALGRIVKGVDYCIHLAAIPSVPRSIMDPWATNRANVEGALNIFLAARDAAVKRVVFSSSSSVYGCSQALPLHEDLPCAPISPYAVSKHSVEQYARVFSTLYDMDIVSLRYFNVFGPRQNPDSPYAAVIPRFISSMLRGERPVIYGDGSQSRDFTFVENVARANLHACLAPGRIAGVYNIACGCAVTVRALAERIANILGVPVEPDYQPARRGDIPHSLADISRAKECLGYAPVVSVDDGLQRTVDWFKRHEEGRA